MSQHRHHGIQKHMLASVMTQGITMHAAGSCARHEYEPTAPEKLQADSRGQL